MKSVYMAWQAHDPSRAWFPIGRLDFDEERKQYEFAYTRGASFASAKGFSPLVAFPSLQERYVSQELFPIFQNRLLKEGRPEFAEFLHSLAIDSSTPDPIELLAAIPYAVTILMLAVISSNRRRMRLNTVASLGQPFSG